MLLKAPEEDEEKIQGVSATLAAATEISMIKWHLKSDWAGLNVIGSGCFFVIINAPPLFKQLVSILYQVDA